MPDMLNPSPPHEQGSPGEPVSLSACEAASVCDPYVPSSCPSEGDKGVMEPDRAIRQTGRNSRGGSGSGTGMTRDWRDWHRCIGEMSGCQDWKKGNGGVRFWGDG